MCKAQRIKSLHNVHLRRKEGCQEAFERRSRTLMVCDDCVYGYEKIFCNEI